MEENLNDALHTGVTIFIFVAAVSVALLLMQNISKMAELSLESLETMDKNVIQRTQVPAAYVVTGAEIMSYYSNYVMPENTDFEFYLDRANTLSVADSAIGYGTDIHPPIEPEQYISRCQKLVNTDTSQFDTLKTKLNNYFIKVVRTDADKTKVYFIAAGNHLGRAEAFMYCLAQIS